MNAPRERTKIIFDILKSIGEKDGLIKPTQLLSKANLSQKLMNAYLAELLAGNFIAEQSTDKGKVYSLKQRGREYIQRYHTIIEFLDLFGLSGDKDQ